MIRIELSPRGGVRIIGTLKGTLLNRLFEILSDREVVLDLSEVREADAAAVRMLARLPAGRCSLVNCPRWLVLWIERERQPQPPVGAP